LGGGRVFQACLDELKEQFRKGIIKPERGEFIESDPGEKK